MSVKGHWDRSNKEKFCRGYERIKWEVDMSKTRSLNKNVADFGYKGHKYEIDLLLDSINNGYATYDIFDVTNDKKGDCIAQFELCQQEENDYMPSELIEKAKKEL